MQLQSTWLIEEGSGSPWKGFQIVHREGANNDRIVAWTPFSEDAVLIAMLLRKDEEERHSS